LDGAIVDAKEISEFVAEWFQKVGLAGMILPTDWFGRPDDNFHQLTWIAARNRKVLIELDQQLLLTITQPKQAQVREAELLIEGAAQVVLDWEEYGSFTPHVENCGPGSVRFMLQGASINF
jgi:hypothetical protein